MSIRMECGPGADATARCHCGAVAITLTAPPAEVTECNCSLCRKTGALWAYPSVSEIVSLPDPSLSETYAWNGRHVDFHRCVTCGCVTHWIPRDPGRDGRGVNARLFPPDVLRTARLRHKDGAGTGEYLD